METPEPPEAELVTLAAPVWLELDVPLVGGDSEALALLAEPGMIVPVDTLEPDVDPETFAFVVEAELVASVEDPDVAVDPEPLAIVFEPATTAPVDAEPEVIVVWLLGVDGLSVVDGCEGDELVIGDPPVECPETPSEAVEDGIETPVVVCESRPGSDPLGRIPVRLSLCRAVVEAGSDDTGTTPEGIDIEVVVGALPRTDSGILVDV